MRAMFSGLHDVDWASMHHAYGSAEEVPALLKALRSPILHESSPSRRSCGPFHVPTGRKLQGLPGTVDLA
jgi:hypothetical protein